MLSCVEIARYFVVACLLSFATDNVSYKNKDIINMLLAASLIVIALNVAVLMIVIDAEKCLDMPQTSEENAIWATDQRRMAGIDSCSDASVQEPYYWQAPGAWCAEPLEAACGSQNVGSSAHDIQYCVRTGVTNVVAGSYRASALALLADVMTACVFRFVMIKARVNANKREADATATIKANNEVKGSVVETTNDGKDESSGLNGDTQNGAVEDNNAQTGTEFTRTLGSRPQVGPLRNRSFKLDLGPQVGTVQRHTRKTVPLRFS